MYADELTLCVAEWAGTKCTPPEMALDGSSSSDSTDFSKVMEVKFSGAIGPLGERRLCKIKCIGGEWVGPLCQVKNGEPFLNEKKN